MKTSKYIKTCKGLDGELLILNTYTNELLAIDPKETSQWEFMLDNPNSNKYAQIREILVNKEIFLDDTIDEAARAELKYMEFAHSNKSLILTILPTEDCNFRCQYCYEEHNLGKMRETVVEGIKNFLKKNLYKYDMLQVNWFGGEPLEALDVIFDLSNFFISICSEQRKPYKASMTTNGYSLNADLFTKLYKLHILDYQITLDGLEKSHNYTRPHKDGKNSYLQILTNLREIREKVKTRNATIVIRTNITKSVMEGMDQHIELLQKEFGADSRFGVIFKIAWSNEQGSAFNDTELLHTGELHSVLNKCIGKQMRFPINRGQICSANGICYAAYSNAFVFGADGTIYKCTVEYKKEINKVGQIKQNGELVIDKNKWAFWVTTPPFKGEYEKCSTCFFRPACMGAYCPINRFDSNGNHRCVGMKDYVETYMLLCSQNATERITTNE